MCFLVEVGATLIVSRKKHETEYIRKHVTQPKYDTKREILTICCAVGRKQ